MVLALGIALAYAWASFPFTLYALESNANDTLVAVFVLAAILAATYHGRLAPPLRGGDPGGPRRPALRLD